MSIHLSDAVAAGILSPAEATAIESGVIDHGGAVELRLHDLTDEDRTALDRYLRWQDSECCGQ